MAVGTRSLFPQGWPCAGLHGGPVMGPAVPGVWVRAETAMSWDKGLFWNLPTFPEGSKPWNL